MGEMHATYNLRNTHNVICKIRIIDVIVSYFLYINSLTIQDMVLVLEHITNYVTWQVKRQTQSLRQFCNIEADPSNIRNTKEMERACYASTLFLCYCLIGTKHVCPKKHHLREYFLSTETHDEKLSFGLVDSSTLLSNLNYANLFQHVQAFPKLQRKYVLQVKRLRIAFYTFWF